MINKLFDQMAEMTKDLHKMTMEHFAATDEPISQKCKSCGAIIKGTTANEFLTCEYCKTKTKNKNYVKPKPLQPANSDFFEE
ncbi:MAG: hypothetical protein E7379_03505 [Clostridiales bacterium]|nr:hypothetical protein [Clostridiales bacterium]